MIISVAFSGIPELQQSFVLEVEGDCVGMGVGLGVGWRVGGMVVGWRVGGMVVGRSVGGMVVGRSVGGIKKNAAFP